MNAAAQVALRLAEFRELRARGALCTGVTEQLAEEAADTFLHQYHAHGDYLRDAITLLAEIAFSLSVLSGCPNSRMPTGFSFRMFSRIRFRVASTPLPVGRSMTPRN